MTIHPKQLVIIVDNSPGSKNELARTFASLAGGVSPQAFFIDVGRLALFCFIEFLSGV